MRGEAGASRVEVNAYGRVIRELAREPGVPGEDVWLTIDRELQKFADERLGGESAACVVMDVQTGDVLALSSTPGFDPNLFNVGITPRQWTRSDHRRSQAADQQGAISGVYPPGSTFKPAVALAAVRSGHRRRIMRVNLHRRAHASAITSSIAGRRAATATWICSAASQHSCDVFFYEVARRLGIDKIEEAARKLGLGAATGIEIPGERGGFIPSARLEGGDATACPGSRAKRSVAGIGQGYVLVDAAAALHAWPRASRAASAVSSAHRAHRSAATRSRARCPSRCHSPTTRSPRCATA